MHLISFLLQTVPKPFWAADNSFVPLNHDIKIPKNMSFTLRIKWVTANKEWPDGVGTVIKFFYRLA